MYVINSETMQKKIIVSKAIGEWLIEHNIPLLSKNSEEYIFSDTDELKKMLLRVPSELKGGEICE